MGEAECRVGDSGKAGGSHRRRNSNINSKCANRNIGIMYPQLLRHRHSSGEKVILRPPKL